MLPLIEHGHKLGAAARAALEAGVSGFPRLQLVSGGGISPWILGGECAVKCGFMPLVSFCLADVSGIDWMVRHGRSLALSVAVNVAPSRLCTGKHSSEVQDMILSNATADRVRPSPVFPSPTLCHHPVLALCRDKGACSAGCAEPGFYHGWLTWMLSE